MKPIVVAVFLSLLLSACLQEKSAPIEYKGGHFYGRQGAFDAYGNELPKYSDERPAELPPEQAEKYVAETQQYGPAAEIGTVTTSDLPPPSAAPMTPATPPATDSFSLGATPEISSAAPVVNEAAPVAAAPAPPQPLISRDAAAVAQTPKEESSLSSLLDDMPWNKADETVTNPSYETASIPPETAAAPVAEAGQESFIWPVRGKVISTFGKKTAGQENDGINIAARAGEPIRASADGTVVYAGNELAGYGNMAILRHPGDWLSAYAHASELVVKKDDWVVKGQLIGFVGQTGNVDTPQLHFSLRKDKQPVDPQPLLRDD